MVRSIIVKTPIINISDDIINRDFRIEELNNKREILSNDVNKLKRKIFQLNEFINDDKKNEMGQNLD